MCWRKCFIMYIKRQRSSSLWCCRTTLMKLVHRCLCLPSQSSIATRIHRSSLLTLLPHAAGSLLRWTLSFHHQTNWRSFLCFLWYLCLTLERSSILRTIQNRFGLSRRHRGLRSFDRWFGFSIRSRGKSWRLWVLIDLKCTFGINGSSSIGVKKIKSLLDFHDFLLSQAWPFIGLGIKLFGFAGCPFLHFKFNI